MVAFAGTGNWTYQSSGGQVVVMISAICGTTGAGQTPISGAATVTVGGISAGVQAVYTTRCASFTQATLGAGAFGVSVTASGASAVFVVILEAKR
jgi:hypothetical protein